MGTGWLKWVIGRKFRNFIYYKNHKIALILSTVLKELKNGIGSSKRKPRVYVKSNCARNYKVGSPRPVALQNLMLMSLHILAITDKVALNP